MKADKRPLMNTSKGSEPPTTFPLLSTVWDVLHLLKPPERALQPFGHPDYLKLHNQFKNKALALDTARLSCQI